jgi:hypothetical protein
VIKRFAVVVISVAGKGNNFSVILDIIIVLNSVFIRTQFLTKFSKENVLAVDSHLFLIPNIKSEMIM